MEEEDEYEDSIIVVQIDARIDKKKNKQMKMFVMDSNQKRIKDFIHQYME